MDMELCTTFVTALIQPQTRIFRHNTQDTLQLATETLAETLDALMEEPNPIKCCRVVQIGTGEFQFCRAYVRDLCAKIFCHRHEPFVLSKELSVGTRPTRQTVAISTPVFPEIQIPTFGARAVTARAVNGTTRLPLRFHLQPIAGQLRCLVQLML
jgi:hypothetical protein